MEPFRMAVIGTSLSWGQGHVEENKYYSRVLAFLAPKLNGRTIEKHVAAHSGAVFGFSVPETADSDWAQKGVPGEVPKSFPSIAWQATHQIPQPETIDLLLMDGGMNDVDIRYILTLDYTINLDALRWRTQECVYKRLKGVLKDVILPAYRKATIVIPNYFPIISPTSRTDAAMIVTSAFLGIGGFLLTNEIHRKLADQCRVFHEESTAGIQQAITEVMNEVHPQPPQRVLFVNAGFGADNAVGAPWPWLYGLGDQDEEKAVTTARQTACTLWTNTLSPDRITCNNAYVGHPNQLGVNAYTRAIFSCIEQFAHEWAAPRPECDQIRGDIAQRNGTISQLREGLVGLNPKDRADWATIRQTNIQIDAIGKEIRALYDRAQALGCGL